MTFGVIYEKFGLMVPHGRLGECISELEDALRSMQETPYHAVLDRDFHHLVDPAAQYLARVHGRVSSRIKVKALYFEMNDFTINPNRWFFSGFAYLKTGDIWDLDWLADWDDEDPEEFTLTGMERVQEAFARLYVIRDGKGPPLTVRVAGELAEHLVLARYMELVAEAHEKAKTIRPELGGVPVLATAHDWEVVHVTE